MRAVIVEFPSDPKFIDLTGQRFGRLLVESYAGKKTGRTAWNCLCECGNLTVVRGDALNRGTRSCGCLKREIILAGANHRHGGSKEHLYALWNGIKKRCRCKTAINYHNYGGRGISIADEFLDYEVFKDFIMGTFGRLPEPGESLDRIDNSRGYERGNLRLATATEQSRNTRRNLMVAWDGKEMCLIEAVERYGATRYKTVHTRLRRLGWSLEKALLTPSRNTNKR